MFYHFERHDSDGNDNSITDVVVEASSQEEAEKILADSLEEWECDNGADELVFMKDVGDITYYKTFFFMGEHDDIAQVNRSRYHGYEEWPK